jgi:hypothetical protein
VHWIGGTAEIQRSILASVCFTAFSTSFNVFAMRRGVLVVGQDEKSLREDMKRIPGIIFAYLSSLISIIVCIRDTLVRALSESMIRARSSLRAGKERFYARFRKIGVSAETSPGTSRKKIRRLTPELRKSAIFGRKPVRWLYTSHRRPIKDLVNNRKMEELTSE